MNTYKANEFEFMIEKEKPDVVLVTSIDRTHDHYIIRAMELGCDVITEKPMTRMKKNVRLFWTQSKERGKNCE